MIDSLHVSQTGPELPSPWWLKGGAIFIGVLGLSSLLGAVSLAFSGVMMEAMMEDLNAEEVCTKDPVSGETEEQTREREVEKEECESFINQISEISELSLWDVGAAFSALLFLLSIPTTILMWNAEDRNTALKLAWAWVTVHATSQFYLVHSYMTWMDDFYEEIPMEDAGWVSLFTAIASYGSVMMCELIMAAGLVLISYKTRPPTTLEMPSAFHIGEE